MAAVQVSDELPEGFTVDPAELPEGFSVDPPKRKVGAVESAMRTVQESARLALQNYDVIAGSLKSVLGGGKAPIYVQARPSKAEKPDEEFSTGGAVMGALASIPTEVLGGFGTQHGTERGIQLTERGATPNEATKGAAVSAGVHAALNALPIKAGGAVGKAIESRIGGVLAGAGTGGAIAGAGGVAGRAAENAALPEGEQFQDLDQEQSLKAVALDVAMGAGFGGGAGAIASRKARKAKAAEAKNAFPTDKMTVMEDGKFRTPNGSTITQEDWAGASERVRKGWLEKEPELPKEPAEAKLPAEIDRLREEHPSGPVADALREVEAKREKTARTKADAAELRKAAEQTTDAEIKKVLNSRADKIDPPEKIPTGEVKEGQPEIKVEQPKKVPAGEVREGQPEIKTEKVEPIPKGEAIEEKIPVGETNEVPDVGGKIPVGEAREIASGVTPTDEPKAGAIPSGEAKELYVPPEKRDAKANEENAAQKGQGQAADAVQGPEALSEQKDLTFPQIDETLLNQARREPVLTHTTPPKRVIERGAAAVRKTLDDAVKSGKLDKDTAEMANWVLDRNPRIGRNLGVTVEASHEQGAYGAYNPTQRVVRLFKESSGPNAAHEIMHHTERMMPHEVQQGIQKEWKRGLERAMRDATPEQRRAMRDAQEMITGATQEARDAAQKRMVQAFKDGTLVGKDHYHLVDPSEFWAVNASRILNERFTSRGTWRAKAVQWLREFVEKAKGTLGLRSDAAVLKALDDVMAGKGRSQAGRQIVTSEKLAVRGEQLDITKVKSYTHEVYDPRTGKVVGKYQSKEAARRGQDRFDNAYGAYRYQVRPFGGEAAARSAEGEQLAIGPAKPAKRELPEEGKTDVVERKLFDRFNRVAKLQKTEAPKGDDSDIYLADKLYQGRAQHRGDVLERDFIKPLGQQLEAAKKLDLTVKDADDYVMALHAPERNREIAKINTKMRDGGSGLTNKQAQDIIDSFTPEQRAALDKIAGTVHGMNQKKLNDLVEDGLIKPEVRDTLNRKYKKYVPLKSLDEEEEFTGVGQGYSMRANDIQEALGRQSKASSPIAASMMDAARSIVRGEKARVDRAIWEYTKNPEVHDFIKPYDPDKPPPEVMGRKKGSDGKVKMVVDSNKVKDLTIDLVIDGEQQKVLVGDKLLRDQIKKLATVNDPGAVLGAIGKVTSTIGRMLTEFNPAFIVPNAVRDAITVGVRAKAHGLNPASVVGGIPKAWADIVAYKRNPNSPEAKVYKEFLQTGGKTGAYGTVDMLDTMKRLEAEGAKLGYDKMEGGALRKTKNVLKSAAKVVSAGNEVMEYAARFSVYKELRAKGESPRQAASAAKEVTVNFNRSGEYGRALNSAFVFANAALQGLRNLGVYSKNPAVQRGMLGVAALGAAAQAYNEMVGGMNADTDEPNINTQNDSITDKNLTILAPGSTSGIKIPLPPEYAWLYTLGRRAYRAFSQGDVGREVKGSLGAMLDATLPVRLPEAESAAGSAAKALVITPATPFVDIWDNKNYFGQAIVPETYNDKSPPPFYKISRSTTSDITKAVSEGLNTITGGDKITPGASQKAFGPLVSPEGIEHLLGYYTGGIGQLAMQSKNLAAGAAKGKPVDTNKIPIANRFVFEEPKSYTSRRYKELTPEFEYARDYQKAGTPDKIEPKIARALGEFEGAEKELRVLFKRLRTASGDPEKESIQADIKRAQARVIKAYNGQPQ